MLGELVRNGGVPVGSRLGHVAEPTQLGPEAAGAYWNEVLAAGRVVIAAFKPVKVNYFMLGNTVPHLHTHVVPRYAADAAPGGSPGIRWSAARCSTSRRWAARPRRCVRPGSQAGPPDNAAR